MKRERFFSRRVQGVSVFLLSRLAALNCSEPPLRDENRYSKPLALGILVLVTKPDVEMDAVEERVDLYVADIV